MIDFLRVHRVLVAPKATGICGSDVHYLKHGELPDIATKICPAEQADPMN